MKLPATMPFLRDYAAVRNYLYGLKHHGAKFGIDRMRLLSERLGNPHAHFPVVHVAGTNGKGSVAAMVESVLRRGGFKTGLYTSPHLLHQGERVQVDRINLTEAEIVAYVRELQPLASELGARDPDDHPSFFEFMTAMAFVHFMRHHVDIAIIEVGLGGRLDATNVVEPEVSVIASISLDHTEILGTTLGSIATEKSGVIKPGRPVVIGRLQPEAESVIRKAAVDRGCPVDSLVEVFGDGLGRLPLTNLEGSFQRANAGVAKLVLRRLPPRFAVSEETIRRGLQEVNWPGRWQRLAIGGREFVFDAAHNPDGAVCLEENISRFVGETGRRPHVVLGVLGAARAAAIVPTAARYARSLHLVLVPHQPRASSVEELRVFVPADFTGPVDCSRVDELFPAAGVCTVGRRGEAVVVTGSIYLVGDVMDRLLNEQPLGQGKLQD
ncbi:MAG TPA: folylpolyglutamate synthase/dihydrofolate synthase family protein [Opitutaceae bacterium]